MFRKREREMFRKREIFRKREREREREMLRERETHTHTETERQRERLNSNQRGFEWELEKSVIVKNKCFNIMNKTIPDLFTLGVEEQWESCVWSITSLLHLDDWNAGFINSLNANQYAHRIREWHFLYLIWSDTSADMYAREHCGFYNYTNRLTLSTVDMERGKETCAISRLKNLFFFYSCICFCYHCFYKNGNILIIRADSVKKKKKMLTTFVYCNQIHPISAYARLILKFDDFT